MKIDFELRKKRGFCVCFWFRWSRWVNVIEMFQSVHVLLRPLFRQSLPTFRISLLARWHRDQRGYALRGCGKQRYSLTTVWVMCELGCAIVYWRSREERQSPSQLQGACVGVAALPRPSCSFKTHLYVRNKWVVSIRVELWRRLWQIDENDIQWWCKWCTLWSSLAASSLSLLENGVVNLSTVCTGVGRSGVAAPAPLSVVGIPRLCLEAWPLAWEGKSKLCREFGWPASAWNEEKEERRDWCLEEAVHCQWLEGDLQVQQTTASTSKATRAGFMFSDKRVASAFRASAFLFRK